MRDQESFVFLSIFEDLLLDLQGQHAHAAEGLFAFLCDFTLDKGRAHAECTMLVHKCMWDINHRCKRCGANAVAKRLQKTTAANAIVSYYAIGDSKGFASK